MRTQSKDISTYSRYSNLPAFDNFNLEKKDPVLYWKQMRETRLNAQLSMNQGNSSNRKSKRSHMPSHPPKTIMTHNPSSSQNPYLKKDKSNYGEISYQHSDLLTKSSQKLDNRSHLLITRQSQSKNQDQTYVFNTRSTSNLPNKYTRSAVRNLSGTQIHDMDNKITDQFSKTSKFSGPPSNHKDYSRYNPYTTKVSADIKDNDTKNTSQLDSRSSVRHLGQEKNKFSDYLHDSRNNTSNSRLPERSSSRYLDSDVRMVESRILYNNTGLDSTSNKKYDNHFENSAHNKNSETSSNRIFKTMEFELGPLDSNYLNSLNNNRIMRQEMIINQNQTIATKNRLNLESIQEKVLLRSRNDQEQGSTTRYLQNHRVAQQQYNSGETSSMDSKDYDIASNSSLALSYGNLETNLDRFNDKLQVLENKLNDIELSRTNRKAIESGQVSSVRHKNVSATNSRSGYQIPTASSGEHSTKPNYSKYDAIRKSIKNQSPPKKYTNKPELNLSYRKNKQSLKRSITNVQNSSGKKKKESSGKKIENKYLRTNTSGQDMPIKLKETQPEKDINIYHKLQQREENSAYSRIDYEEMSNPKAYRKPTDKYQEEEDKDLFYKQAGRSNIRNLTLANFNPTPEIKFSIPNPLNDNTRKHSHQNVELSNYNQLNQEDIYLDNKDKSANKYTKYAASEHDVQNQKRAFQDQMLKEIKKYGGIVQTDVHQSSRTSLKPHSKYGPGNSVYNKVEAPKIQNKYSNTSQFSKSYSNLKGLSQRTEVEEVKTRNQTPKTQPTSQLNSMISNLQQQPKVDLHDLSSTKSINRSASANFNQVSCLERVAQEVYSKQRVNPQTAFGKFLSDCKDQLILAKRVKQNLETKPHSMEKIRWKRDFKKLKTILLDLDETLIHSEEWVRGKKYDLEVEIDVEDGKKDVKNRSIHQTLLR